MTTFSELIKEKKNFIFIGETGSGKSEAALNTAVLLRNRGDVHLFDLDQTKAMFRARDAEGEMAKLGIRVHYMPQLLDTPVMVNGIIPHIKGKNSLCVLDVGGNENAARMVGCLSDYLNNSDTAAIYVLNPYRPWSGTAGEIRETLAEVQNACHLESVLFAANPNIGPSTGADDVTAGMEQILKDFPAEELTGVFVGEKLISQEIHYPGTEIIPLHPYLKYPWNKE